MTKNHYSILITGILSTLISVSANASTGWTIKMFEDILLTDINDLGQVVGYSKTNENFITGPNGDGMTNILSEFPGSVKAVNNSGQVAGATRIGSYYHAYITEPDGIGMTDLGALSGKSSFVRDINDTGQVTGDSNAKDGYTHAYITGPNGIGMTDLGTLGGSNSYSSAINDSGQVVGWSETDDGSTHAFITGPNGAGMTDLGTLDRDYSSAFDINNFGETVGYTGQRIDIGYSAMRPFITESNGENLADMGSLTFYTYGSFISTMYINDPGQVIINIGAICGTVCADSLLYDDGVVTSISSILDVFDTNLKYGMPQVVGINNDGQIIGILANDLYEGRYRSFMLTPTTIAPVPEPTTYAMLLTGLGLMAFRRNKPVKLICC